MASWRMTPLRYTVIVAAIYFVSFLIMGLSAGGLHERSPELLVLLPLSGGGIGVLVTWVAIVRFGDRGGSIYFTPTVIHLGLAAAAVFGVALQILR